MRKGLLLLALVICLLCAALTAGTLAGSVYSSRLSNTVIPINGSVSFEFYNQEGPAEFEGTNPVRFTAEILDQNGNPLDADWSYQSPDGSYITSQLRGTIYGPSYYVEGTYTLRICVYGENYSYPDNDKYITSNHTITFGYEGDLEDPEVTVASQFALGSDIPVSISCENAEWYNVRIARNGTQIFGDTVYAYDGYNYFAPVRFTDEDILLIDESVCAETGDYTISVKGFAAGWTLTNEVTGMFSVTGEKQEGPAVAALDDEYVSGEEGHFRLYATGATSFTYQLYEPAQYEGDEEEAIGEASTVAAMQDGSAEITVINRHPGEWKIKAKALVNGAWTLYSETSFRVISSYAPPTITLDKDTFAIDEDVTGSVTAPQNKRPYLSLYKVDGDHEYYCGSGGSYSSGNPLITHNQFDGPGTYRLEAYFYDWDKISGSVTFTVDGPDAPVVTVNTAEATLDENVVFTITCQDDAEILYRMYRDGELFSSYDTTAGYAENGTYRWYRSFSEPGDYDFVFLTKTYDEDQGVSIRSKSSDPVSIHVVSLGTTDKPSAVVPQTLKAGEELNILLNGVPHADTYRLEVYQERETGYQSQINSMTLTAPGAVCPEPYGLDAGNYVLKIAARGKGYTQSESEGYPFTVTGKRPAKSLVTKTIPSGTKRPYDTVWFTAKATGLEACRISRYYSPSSTLYLAENGTVSLPAELDYAARFSGSFRARIKGCWTEEIQVTITGTPVDYDDLEFTLPESIQLGKDLTFTTELWSKAEYYTYSLARIITHTEYGYTWEDGQQIIYEEIFTPTSNGKGTIPAQYFTQPGKWAVGVNAYGKDGGVRYAGGYVMVTENPDRPEAPTVTLMTENPQHNDEVVFNIQTDGAEQICIIPKILEGEYSVADKPYILDTDGEETYEYVFNTKDFPNCNASDFYIIVSACKNGVWSDYCEPVVFLVAYDGDLDLNYRSITVTPAEALPGDTVTVAWEPAEGAEWYSVSLDNERVLVERTEESSVVIPTEGIAVGTHQIEIKAYAIGKRKAVAYGELNLVNNAWKPTVSVSKAEAALNETVRLTIKSTGGQVLFIYLDDQLYGTMKRSTAGSQVLDLKMDRIGTHRIRVSAANKTSYPTVWSARSNTVAVRVTDPAKTPEIVIPNNVSRIGDETFSGVTNVKIWVPATVKFISDNAFDSSVTIVTPAGSYAATWAVEHGVEVIIE